VEPLRKLTRQATEALKNQLAEASMTTFNSKEAPTEVVTDASPVGLVGIHVQEKQRVSSSGCISEPKLK